MISTIMLGHALAVMVWNAIGFPALETQTDQGKLLLIDDAYRNHGKDPHNAIVVMPFGADIRVANVDYDFMLTHRRLGADGIDPDKIASNGYFCARVTLQQAGSAIRVLPAGSSSLPEDSIQLCPADPVGQSQILVVRNGKKLGASANQP